MSDWDDIIRDRMLNEVPLPVVDDWEWFDAMYHRHLLRKRLTRWSAVAGSAAAVVTILFLLFFRRDHVSMENQPVPVSQSLTASTDIIKDIKPEALPLMSYSLPAPETGEKMSEDKPDSLFGETLVNSLDLPVHEEEETPNDVKGEEKFSALNQREVFRRRNVKVSTRFGRMGGDAISLDAAVVNPRLAKNYPRLAPDPFNGMASSGAVIREVSHSIPLSFGVDVSVPLDSRLAVTTGIDLTYYKSGFSILTESYTQSVYYLGIPLRLDWIAWTNGPVSALVGVGGKVDHLIYGRTHSRRLSDSSFHWSLTAAAGIHYEIVPSIDLFFEPGVSFYLKPRDPAILTYRTEHPMTMALGAGIRVSF